MTNEPTKYDLLTPEGFDAYARRFGYAAAKSARFLLAYTQPYRGPAAEPMKFAGARTGRFSSTGRHMREVEPQRITLNAYIKQQTQAGNMLRSLFAADYAEIERRAMAWVKSEYPPVNPTPHYCYYMSAASCCAVYKAHVATDNSYDFAAWCDLSYATDNGIVFG